MPETKLLKLIALPIPGAYIEEKRALALGLNPPNFIPPSKVLPAIFLLTAGLASIGANVLVFGLIVF